MVNISIPRGGRNGQVRNARGLCTSYLPSSYSLPSHQHLLDAVQHGQGPAASREPAVFNRFADSPGPGIMVEGKVGGIAVGMLLRAGDGVQGVNRSSGWIRGTE